jgi:hypothetical protein
MEFTKINAIEQSLSRRASNARSRLLFQCDRHNSEASQTRHQKLDQLAPAAAAKADLPSHITPRRAISGVILAEKQRQVSNHVDGSSAACALHLGSQSLDHVLMP